MARFREEILTSWIRSQFDFGKVILLSGEGEGLAVPGEGEGFALIIEGDGKMGRSFDDNGGVGAVFDFSGFAVFAFPEEAEDEVFLVIADQFPAVAGGSSSVGLAQEGAGVRVVGPEGDRLGGRAFSGEGGFGAFAEDVAVGRGIEGWRGAPGDELVDVLLIGAEREEGDGSVVGAVAIHDGLVDGGEEGGEGVVILHRDGIELVVVAGRATGGETEPGGGDGVGAIHEVFHAVFLLNHSALVGGRIAFEEASGDGIFLILGEEVAGELADRKLVEGKVVVEGVDDPLAVGPDCAEVVVLKSMGVGVAGGIEPEAGAVFAVMGGSEVSVDESFVGNLAAFELFDLLDFWWQSGEVEGKAANEASGGGLLLAVGDDFVDFRAGIEDGFEAPMGDILRSGLNPVMEELFFVA